MLDNDPAAAPAPADIPAADAPAPASDPAAAAPASDAPPAGDDPAPSGDADAPKRTPWFQERINELTRKNFEKRRARADAAEAALMARLQGDKPEGQDEAAKPTGDGKRVYTEDEVRQLVAREAAQKAEIDSFNKACDAAFDKGAAKHADFKDAVATLTQAGVISQQDISFVQDALETEAPEEVLYHLGKNPEEALELMRLNPRARAIRLDRLARTLSTPAAKPISAAPPPGTPVGGSAKAELDLYDPNLSTAEFVRRRNEEEAAARRR
jgi:hypothetical protein